MREHIAEIFSPRPPESIRAFTGDEAAALKGRTIARYRLLSLVGAGGMGRVYLAEDTAPGRRVALKLLPAYFTSDKHQVRRFHQESRAASALNHPNILTVHEVGQADGMEFIATEYVEGETLREHLTRAPFGVREALDVAAQVADALLAAHAGGIVHRDIKPENVMLRTDGYVKVLDFGLAKLTENLSGLRPAGSGATAGSTVRTKPGVVMGTVQYMSPEQARGKDTDARTDIFSLGAVLYEMLAGRAPFAGETSADVIGALLHKEPQPLTELVPGTPAELQQVVSKALRKDPEERYQTARSLLADLRALKQELDFNARIERSGAPTSARQPGPTQDRNARTATSAEYFVGGVKRQRFAVAAVLAVLVVALGLAGYFVFRAAPDQSPITSVAVLPFRNEGGDPEPRLPFGRRE